MFGCFIAGLVYGLVALLIFKFGSEWINKILPPVVIGPVIMVIGLSLAGTAIGMAMNKTVDGASVYSLQYFLIALATLAIAVIATAFLKAFKCNTNITWYNWRIYYISICWNSRFHSYNKCTDICTTRIHKNGSIMDSCYSHSSSGISNNNRTYWSLNGNW